MSRRRTPAARRVSSPEAVLGARLAALTAADLDPAAVRLGGAYVTRAAFDAVWAATRDADRDAWLALTPAQRAAVPVAATTRRLAREAADRQALADCPF